MPKCFQKNVPGLLKCLVSWKRRLKTVSAGTGLDEGAFLRTPESACALGHCEPPARSAACAASADCCLLALPAFVYVKFVAERHRERLEFLHTLDFLTRHALFRKWSPRDRTALANATVRRDLRAGCVAARRGGPLREVLLVAFGELKLESRLSLPATSGSNTAKFKEAELSRLAAGSLVGAAEVFLFLADSRLERTT